MALRSPASGAAERGRTSKISLNNELLRNICQEFFLAGPPRQNTSPKFLDEAPRTVYIFKYS